MTLLVAVALYALYPVGFGYGFGWPPEDLPSFEDQWFVATYLLTLVATLLLQMPTLTYALAGADGKKLELKDYLISLKRLIPFIAVAITIYLLVTFGFLLLIVPGLFLLARFFLFPFVVLENIWARSARPSTVLR